MALCNRKLIQCIAAHKANVNCLEIGHKSGQIMVSGGDDSVVKFWAVGQDQCILSLTGHTSPVQAVALNQTENVVGTGSYCGMLKIWDLETKKLLSTMKGHHSSVNCMSFHPSGNVLASGSSNANVKGHSKAVNSIKFSPHGSWLVSGSDDKIIKLWDITMGKLLTEFTEHSASVNCIEFHPRELLLVSGSTDRTVKFWDLEQMKMLSSVGGSCSPIRSLAFAPNGLCVYAGIQDFLKVCHWQPPRCLHSLLVGWGSVSDMAFTEQQLIGATITNSNISSYIVDIQKLPVNNMNELPMKSSESGIKNSGTGMLVQATSCQDLPMSSVLWPVNCPRDEIISEPVVCDLLVSGASLPCCKTEDLHQDVYSHQPGSSSLSPPSPHQQDRKSPPARNGCSQLSPRQTSANVSCDASWQSVGRLESQQGHATERKSDLNQVFNDGQLTNNKSSFYTCLREIRHTKVLESANKPRNISAINVTSCKHNLPTPSATYTNVLFHEPTPTAIELGLSSVNVEEDLSSCRATVDDMKSLQSSKTTHEDLISFTDDELPSTGSLPDQPTRDDPCPRMLNSIPSVGSDSFLLPHKLDSEKSLESKFPEKMAASSNMLRSPTKSSKSGFPCRVKSPKSAMPFDSKSPRIDISSDASSPKFVVSKDTNSPRSVIASETSSSKSISSTDSSSPRSAFCSPRLLGASCKAGDQELKSNSDQYVNLLCKTREKETLKFISNGHHSLQSSLLSRLQCLRTFSSNYSVSNIKTAFGLAQSAKDHELLHSLINIVVTKSSNLNLNLCFVLLPILRDAIKSPHVKCVCAGMSAVELIVQRFAAIIKSNIAARPPIMGIDVAADERFDKCKFCHRELTNIQSYLKSKHVGVEQRNEQVEFKENELLSILSRAGYR